MLKDITLGQYFPDDTVVHRLDPRTKIILVVLYIAELFIAKSWISYGLMFMILVACMVLARAKPKTVLRGMKPLVFVIVFTAILNVFFTAGPTVLVQFWVIKITKEGLVTAAMMVCRIIMLVVGTFLLTYATSPLALTDGLETLFRPLKKVKFPVHEMSMIMSIALRFIPTLIEETDKIMSAQKARGADFESGNLVEKARALLPLLVPLFISAFRRADELAVAMESRCYHGDSGRTRMKELKLSRRDWLAFLWGAVTRAAVIYLSAMGL